MLYTPAVLALATSLSDFPLDPSFPRTASVRSSTCGSELEMGLMLREDGMIAGIGIAARACAIGQASAAIFALSARGKGPADILCAGQAIRLWLAGEGQMPDLPALNDIAAVQTYAARHGAVMLPWLAAERLLGEMEATG